MEEKYLKHTAIFDLVEKQDDGTIGFNPIGINSKDWVTIIVAKGNDFLIVKQLRYGIMKECEEFCCGMVEKDEKPIDAAIRELREETGLEIHCIDDVKYLGSFAANPAFMSNKMHYYYINVDALAGYHWTKPELDEHEKLTIYWRNKENFAFDCMHKQESVFMATGIWLLEKNGFKI